MLFVWGVPLLADCETVLRTLRTVLHSEERYYLGKIKPTRNNIMISCPNHGDGQEAHPSCGVSTKDVMRRGVLVPAGTVHCFTCGYHVDLPEMVSNCFGHYDKGKFGYKWLTKNFISVAIDDRQPIELNIQRGSTAQEPERVFVSEEELAGYRYYHPYMYDRMLTDKVIDYFDVGYDAETECLTFPVHRHGDKAVILVQRRSVKSKFFGMPEDKEKTETIYGLWAVYANLDWVTEVVVCESIIDALTMWTQRRAAIALMGAQPGGNQMKLLKALPVRKLILALDNDEAGWKGHDVIYDELFGKKLLYDLIMPLGVKDINQAAQEGRMGEMTTTISTRHFKKEKEFTSF